MKFFIRVLLTCMCLTAYADQPASHKIVAPPFELPDIYGKTQHRLSDYQGQVIYLDFWASWCGPCRKSLPMLNELRKELHTQGFEVIAINLDEEAEMGHKFLEKFPVSYPILFDDNGSTPRAYEVRAMPTSYLIDRQGYLRKVHQGFKPSDMKNIRLEVKELLEEAP